MWLVYADVELVNSDDLALVNAGFKKDAEVRRETVNVLVDSGAYMLCVNEKIRAQLGLKTILRQSAQLANGDITEVDIVGPVEVNFLNRSTSCRAMVLPGDNEPLLGAIPMEDLDVIIDPREKNPKTTTRQAIYGTEKPEVILE